MRKILLGIACLGLGACATAGDMDRQASREDYLAAKEAAAGDKEDASLHRAEADRLRRRAQELRMYYYYDYAGLPPAVYF